MTQLSAKINSITDEDVASFENSMSFHVYQHIATKSAIYPGQGTMLGMSYCAHKLAGEAGEFNEHFGKAQRDDGLFSLAEGYEEMGGGRRSVIIIRPLTSERKEYLIKELGDCLWYISALCNELGLSLASVALMNLKKLARRSQLDRLSGAGDDR